jgi:hypothetical protein
MNGISRDGRNDPRGAAPAQRVAVRRLRLRLSGVTPGVARELALGIANELAVAAPGAAGLETRLRVESRALDPTTLARRVALGLVRPRRSGAR